MVKSVIYVALVDAVIYLALVCLIFVLKELIHD